MGRFTRLFGSFHWKFSGINEISEKVVPRFPGGKFVSHLTNRRQFFMRLSFY